MMNARALVLPLASCRVSSRDRIAELQEMDEHVRKTPEAVFTYDPSKWKGFPHAFRRLRRPDRRAPLAGLRVANAPPGAK